MNGHYRQGRWLVLLALVIGCSSAVPSAVPSSSMADASPSATTQASADSSAQPPTAEHSPAVTLGPVVLPPLPTALQVDGETPQAVGAAVGQALAPDSPDLIAALVAAFEGSGIPIIRDGTRSPAGAPGYAVQDWEIQLIGDSYMENGAAMRLSDVGDMLVGLNDAELDPARVTQLILEALRQASSSDDAELATWAATVDAVAARIGEAPVTSEDPSAVLLDAAALQLVLRRLAHELILRGPPPAAATSVLAAAYAPPAIPREVRYASQPCTIDTEAGDWIMWGAEEGTAFGFGQLIDYLEEAGVGGAGRVKSVSETASALADFATFILSYLLLDVNIALDGSGPLQRTRFQRPVTGERRNLAATIRYSTGKAQAVNCLRLVFASMGVTFSLPQDGPVSGMGVRWEERAGFDARSDRIVQFVGNPEHGRTEPPEGVARIGVEGFGQKLEVPPNTGRIQKKAAVALTVQIKDNDIVKDFWEAFKLAQGNIGISAALKFMYELVYRTKLIAPNRYEFTVLDWGEEWSFAMRVDVRGMPNDARDFYQFDYTGTFTVENGQIQGSGTGAVGGHLHTCVYNERYDIDVEVVGSFAFSISGSDGADGRQITLDADDVFVNHVGGLSACEEFRGLLNMAVADAIEGAGSDPFKIPTVDGTTEVNSIETGIGRTTVQVTVTRK